MNERETEEIKKLLKEFVPPTRNAELERDLWPAMLKRLEEPAMRVPWWDWVLLAGSGVAIWFFPAMIPALVYHL